MGENPENKSIATQELVLKLKDELEEVKGKFKYSLAKLQRERDDADNEAWIEYELNESKIDTLKDHIKETDEALGALNNIFKNKSIRDPLTTQGSLMKLR